MRFVEDYALSGTRRTKDGYLVADVRCARTGIQHYTGAEVGRPDLPIVAVYRPESEVFAADSLRSFAGKPVTDGHPPVPVTADNWKEYAAGAVGNDVLRDGEFVRVPFALMDAATITKTEAGKREISMGYDMELSWTPGTAPDGTAYDAVMTNLRMNHLAIVDRGRAGSECRVGDADKWGAAPIAAKQGEQAPMPDTRKIIVDGIPVETTDAGAAVIEKLTGERDAAKTALADGQTKHAAEIASRDKEIAARDIEIEKLKASTLDSKAIDALVATRAKLVADAKAIAPDVKVEGLSDGEIRAAAVTALRGADAIKDRSEAYVTASFDIAVADKSVATSKPDPVRDALKSRDGSSAADDNGQVGYEKRLNDAWKNSATK